MSQQQKVKNVLTSRNFWLSAAATVGVSLIVYDWYRDRYASATTRYNRIENDYIVPLKQLCKIRHAFIKEMQLGLSEDDEISSNPQLSKSSLKMLSSKIWTIPNGEEKGTYYTLDWGGSNYRVLKITFGGRNIKPVTKQLSEEISSEYMTIDDPNKLFDYLTNNLITMMNDQDNENESKVQGYSDQSNSNSDSKNDTQNTNDNGKDNDNDSNVNSIGFCFSFPMRQPALNKGILVTWTKGFNIPSCVGQDVASLMNSAFERNKGKIINKNKNNIKIKSIVNDTVGTLLACAYDNDNTRIGLILGTGSNACYIEPERQNEIINIEWGNFNKLLPRVPPDWIMDEYTPNRGVYFTEKMVSGMYLGELSRLLAIEVFRESITDYGAKSIMNLKWEFKAVAVSKILEWYFNEDYHKILLHLRNECGLTKFNETDAKVFGQICKLIVYRSADIAAVLLCAVLEKTGLYYTVRKDERNPFENDQFILNKKYLENDNMYITVGVDGSVYHKCTGYANRVKDTIKRILGTQIANKVFMVHSEDGSGKGAALAAAGAENAAQ